MRYTLAELSALTGAELVGDVGHVITGVDTLDEATSEDASFLANPRYLDAMKKSEAGVICIGPSDPRPEGKNFLISEHPTLTFQAIVESLLPTRSRSGFHGIHPSAVIHEDTILGELVTIGPNVVIDRGVKIGSGTYIAPNVSIGFDVTIGSNCTIYPNCTIRERCILGHRVILQPGAVVGSCGFGYAQNSQGKHIKLEQLGVVILEDDVEIGANTTIDRSRFKTTIVRNGTKIDNLVQIAHNVEIGEHNVIAAQTGIAGSSKTGSNVMLGGQVGVVGHVTIGSKVLVATRGGVSKSLKSGKYRGSPAMPIYEYHRQEVHVRKLEEYVQRIKDLEEALSVQFSSASKKCKHGSKEPQNR